MHRLDVIAATKQGHEPPISIQTSASAKEQERNGNEANINIYFRFSACYSLLKTPSSLQYDLTIEHIAFV